MQLVRIDELFVLASLQGKDVLEQVKHLVEKCGIIEEKEAHIHTTVDPVTLYTSYYCGACGTNLMRSLYSSKYCIECGARFIKDDKETDK